MAWKSAWRDRRNYSYHSTHTPSNHRRKSNRLLYRLGLFSFIGVIGLLLLTFIAFPLLAFNLPSPDKLVRRDGFSTKIYDRNKTLLYDIYTNERRTPVKLEDIPPYLKQATIAIEDKNFYKHQGFDPTGFARAMWNIVAHRKLQGGSTLTQQLAKNVLLTSERTVLRKVREFILAAQIERKYSKDEILQMYLNEVPYGGTAWGVGAAADVYFGKSVKDLTLVESAILAGLPQRPSTYSPYSSSSKAYVSRTEQVLRRMKEDGIISKDQEEGALKQLNDVKFVGKGAGFKAPHFVMYVKSLLEERYGTELVEQGGLKVTTTLDWNLQEKAQSVVSEEIEKVENLNITNGASVVIDPNTGEILAMVGSKNFLAEDYDGQVNVTLSLRQPGSTIKPVTYVTGLKKGYTASTLLMDVPTTFPGGVNQPDYKPVSYDGKFRGPVQVRYALANSLNIPAVKMLAMVGVKDMLSTAYDLGLSTLEPTKKNLERFGLSVTLGGGEVRLLDITSAYSAFANGGRQRDSVAILKVEDSKGKVLEESKPSDGRKVLEEGQAFIISDILSDSKAPAEVFGQNSALNISGHTVAAKTGTTNDMRDNWTIGWTPQVVVGVWVGNNDNSQMKKLASGVTGAAPVWRKIMIEVLSDKPNMPFKTPESVVSAEVDSISGHRSHDGYPSRTEFYVKGTEPLGDDPVHKRLKLCKSEGRLATPSQVAAGDYDETEFFVFKEEDPTGSPNRWQEGILTWLNEQSEPKYRPPLDYCGSSNPLNVEFIKPKDREKIDSNDLQIRIDPQSTSDILQVEIYLDDTKQTTLMGAPWQTNLNNVKDGTHELRAVAKDRDGHEADRRIKIGVNVAWDYSASSSSTPSLAP